MKKAHKQFRRNRENLVFNRKFMIYMIPIFIVLGLTGWIASYFLEPAPPTRITLTSGSSGGAYQAFASKYADAMAKDGIEVEIVPSLGSVENYERLKKTGNDVDVGFIQSGIGNGKDAPNLRTLASLYYEPIWVFYNGKKLSRLSQLEGKKIGVNLPGSGVHKLAIELLAGYGITRANTPFQELATQDSIEALKDGRIDAAFFIAAPEAPIIKALLKSKLKLLNFAQADAVLQKFPSLSKVVFPRGAIDLAGDVPSTDVTLLSATALLVAKNNLHPAIAQLMLSKAMDIHGAAGFFSPAGAFPNQKSADFPLSEESKRFFKSGYPFLQRYMPFWLANFIERLLIVLVPMFAMLIPVVQIMPGVYQFFVKADLIRWYGEIKLLEDEVWANKSPTPDQIASWYKEIEDIHSKVNCLDLPQVYFNEVYRLKQSISVVQDRIRVAETRAAAPAADAESQTVQPRAFQSVRPASSMEWPAYA